MEDAEGSTRRLASFYGELSPPADSMMAMLAASGVDVAHVRASDLYTRSLDCHNLGMHAMLQVLADIAAEYATLGPQHTLLDVGCGMGGPGRFLVDHFGCSVVGIDLLPLRIEIAQAITDATGMSDRISYQVADATNLKFDDGSFSQVWMLDVSMHIRDKRALFREITRVLASGGLLVMHEQTAPIPRAMLPVTRRAPYIAPSLPQLIRYVEDGGLRMLTWRDTTDRVLEFFLGVRKMVPEPNPVRDVHDRGQQEPTLALLDGYIETLAHQSGRTGILVAKRVETAERPAT